MQALLFHLIRGNACSARLDISGAYLMVAFLPPVVVAVWIFAALHVICQE